MSGIYPLLMMKDKAKSRIIPQVLLDALPPSPYRSATEFLKSVMSGGLGRLVLFKRHITGFFECKDEIHVTPL